MERSFCILVLCAFFSNLFGAEFIFSAHFSTSNNILTYENFSISPSMYENGFDKNEVDYACTIDRKIKKNQTQYEYLQNSKSELLDCFVGKKVQVYGYDETNLLKLVSSNTQLFVNPIKFRAIFSKDKCYIYVY